MIKKIMIVGLMILILALSVNASSRILPQTTVTNDTWEEIFTYSVTNERDLGGTGKGDGVFKFEKSMLRVGSGSSAFENITNIEFVCYEGTFTNSSGTNILILENLNHTNTPQTLTTDFIDLTKSVSVGCRFIASFNSSIIADSPPWTSRTSFAGFRNDFVCEQQIQDQRIITISRIDQIQTFIVDFIELNFQIILILFWLFVIGIFLAVIAGVALIGIFVFRMIKGTEE